MPTARLGGSTPNWVAVLAIGLAQAACFSDRGLAIEIDVGDTGATSVELYLGGTACEPADNPASIDCRSIAPPPSGAAPLTGRIAFRDTTARTTAPVDGRTATFRLLPDGATDAPLPIAIAVGTKGDATDAAPVGTATLRDLVIPVHSARIARAGLVRAEPVVTDPGDPSGLTGDRVLVWSHPPPLPDQAPPICLVVEHWKDGTASRDFVVPSDDPDCDGKMHECNPSAYLGSEPGGKSPIANCFAHRTDNVCVLGSLGCSDLGGAMPGSCAAQDTEICLPSQLCGCPIASPDEPYPYQECVRSRIAVSTSTVPRIECDVPTLSDRNLCLGNSASFNFNNVNFQDGKCDQPELGSLGLTGFGTVHSFSGAEMELSSPDAPCSVTLTWKRGLLAAQNDDYGMIKIPTPRGAMLVPIVFHFHQDACTTQFTCAFNSNSDLSDAVFQCAQ
jgi:hypothetical protein